MFPPLECMFREGPGAPYHEFGSIFTDTNKKMTRGDIFLTPTCCIPHAAAPATLGPCICHTPPRDTEPSMLTALATDTFLVFFWRL
mmetsp:Transcript_13405/g.21219  ORF Transcript_13405/g.21219 Transcript_13405/m.21219 type:complete len:86 (+) Transcript_13405:3626-3883(+)